MSVKQDFLQLRKSKQHEGAGFNFSVKLCLTRNSPCCTKDCVALPYMTLSNKALMFNVMFNHSVLMYTYDY